MRSALAIIDNAMALSILLFFSCAAETTPYIREQPMYEYFAVGPAYENPWFADGPPLLITVYNPLPYPVEVTSSCFSDGIEHVWTWRVEAKGERRELGQIMNRDLHSGACRIFEWKRADN